MREEQLVFPEHLDADCLTNGHPSNYPGFATPSEGNDFASEADLSLPALLEPSDERRPCGFLADFTEDTNTLEGSDAVPTRLPLCVAEAVFLWIDLANSEYSMYPSSFS